MCSRALRLAFACAAPAGALKAQSARNYGYNLEVTADAAKDLRSQFEVLPPEGKLGFTGGDGDISVVIGGGRTGRRALWIFAETYVTYYKEATETRVFDGVQKPPNSVALVECSETDCGGKPEFYQKNSSQGWTLPFFGEFLQTPEVWPVSAIASRDGNSVLILAQEISKGKDGLEVVGTVSIVVKDVAKVDDPREWKYAMYNLRLEEVTPPGTVWFSAVSFTEQNDSDDVYIFGHRLLDDTVNGTESSVTRRAKSRFQNVRQRLLSDPRGNQYSETMLARAKLSDLLHHEWSGLQYWNEPGEFGPLTTGVAPRTIGAPSWENTITWSEELKLWYTFDVTGWSARALAKQETPRVELYTAQEITGLWMKNDLFDLPTRYAERSSTGAPNWLCYSAKAHPELASKMNKTRTAELVFSYICNAVDAPGGYENMVGKLFQPEGMSTNLRGFWPRFVRVNVQRNDA